MAKCGSQHKDMDATLMQRKVRGSSPPYRPFFQSGRQQDALRIHAILGVFITVALLALFTWAIQQLTRMTNAGPYGILYLIPVAFGSALLGIRGGYITAVAALILDFTLLGASPESANVLNNADALVKILTLAVSMFIVASVTGCLQLASRDLQVLNASLMESEARREAFSREVLLAVTGGRLSLCDDAELQALVANEPALATIDLREARDVCVLRHLLRHIAEGRGFPANRLDELEIAVTEAAANAVKHGGGGTAEIWISPAEASLLIVDHGKGISPADLARATLERGFSTSVSLGMGFTIMLESTDMLALNSSPCGTAVLLRRYNAPPPSLEDRLLARFEPLDVSQHLREQEMRN